MEKIKITKEQEEALKIFRIDKKTNKLHHFILSKGHWTNVYKPLNNFTPEQFALLLCGWYEVEQPFKVGDWFYDEVNNRYWKIREFDGNLYRLSEVYSASENALNSGNYKKVTEPWKIMLLELGRDKPELKDGDVFTTNSTVYPYEVNIQKYTRVAYEIYFENGSVEHFYPVESRIEVKQ